ncbi:MAG TPA: glycosyltransferase family 1 protein, partial [Thermomicrobiales bacterium]|nr:glycosyltransferase family 1 protein [Thermomicrobiales bacterium]
PGNTISVALDMRLAGYRGGGIARYARELRAALGGASSIAVRGIRSQRDTGGADGDLRVRTPPHHRLERFALPVEMALARYQPKVFHATDFIAPSMPRSAVVATVHDLAFIHWPNDLAPDALEYYRQLGDARRRTDAWITPSRWTADDLAGIYGIDRDTIHVIPHGVSLDLMRADPLPRVGRGDYVLAVGTVEPRKRYDLLLDAIQERDDLPRLVIAGGSGWNSQMLENRLRLAARAEWVADAGDDALRRLYREAIALVVPSRAEGFGLPALEAMAVGTPVVSSGGGALPEVTGEAALAVAEASGEAWAAAVERIASDNALWEQLSAAGRVRARRFSWDAAARATAEVYRNLVT